MKKILILGAGFGGLETATGLSSKLGEGYEITLIDKNESFFIGFSKIDVLFGRKTQAQVCYPYSKLRAEGVSFVRETITSIDPDAREVRTSGGSYGYDYLVVGLGADLDHAAVPGFTESGGHEFYSMAGAKALAPVLEDFERGTLVLGIFPGQYKCPPAPYEVACQMHDFFVANGRRDEIELKVVIAGPRPVKNPKVSGLLEAQLAERNITLVPDSPIASINAAERKVVARNATIDYDLFVAVPTHVAPAVVRESALAEKGWIPVDNKTLRTRFDNVYAVGDVTTIPVGDKAVPKAGAFAEDAAKTVVSDIMAKEGKGELDPFKARGACYFELGAGDVAKVDANYLEHDKPMVVVEGPSESMHADKERFATTRRDRWFAL